MRNITSTIARPEPSNTMTDVAAEAIRHHLDRRTRRPPSVVRCGLMLLAVKIALKTIGLERTLQWITRRVTGVPQDPAVSVAAVAETEHAVAMAGAFYPGRAMCLEQSLVLYYVLRRRGATVKYCQGVQLRPFAAHAWVEYRGEVVNDVAEHVNGFARLPEQLP